MSFSWGWQCRRDIVGRESIRRESIRRAASPPRAVVILDQVGSKPLGPSALRALKGLVLAPPSEHPRATLEKLEGALDEIVAKAELGFAEDELKLATQRAQVDPGGFIALVLAHQLHGRSGGAFDQIRDVERHGSALLPVEISLEVERSELLFGVL
ncbi:MAG: hypothetical protein AAFU79_18580 [Myxococcota bacterium]